MPIENTKPKPKLDFDTFALIDWWLSLDFDF
jgi:hypothetical protein